MATRRQINASDPVEVRRSISESARSNDVSRVTTSVVSLAARVSTLETAAVAPTVSGVTTTTDTTYAVATTDEVILCDATSASITVNLPAATANRHLYVKKIDASGNSVTIDGNGSETIDGATTKSTTTQWAGWEIVSDGTGWFIL